MTEQETLEIQSELRKALNEAFVGTKVEEHAVANVKSFITNKMKELEQKGIVIPEPKLTIHGNIMEISWEHQ